MVEALAAVSKFFRNFDGPKDPDCVPDNPSMFWLRQADSKSNSGLSRQVFSIHLNCAISGDSLAEVYTSREV